MKNNGNKGPQSQSQFARKQLAGQPESGLSSPSFRRSTHIEDSLRVQNGAVSAIQSSYMYSDQARQTLERYFSHLLIRDGDRSRFRCGGEFGYKSHQHALGAFLRAHFHDLIMYLYEPRGTCLDIGSSPVRMHSRHQNGRPLLDRVHMMCPVLDVRDDMRVRDNKMKLERLCVEHNKLMEELGDKRVYDPKTHLCAHVGGQEREKCRCNDKFDIITSVDSAYYPGVLEEMFDHLIEDDVNGYVVVNDYLQVLLDGSFERDPGPFETSHKGEIFGRPFGKAEACLNSDGVPESYCYYTIEGNQLWVTSTVQGNPMPYYHGVLNLGQKNFVHKYLGKDGKQYYMLFQEMEVCKNGDIPYKMFKVSPTLRSRWNDGQLREMQVFEELYVSVKDILPILLKNQATDMMSKFNLAASTTCSTNDISSICRETSTFEAPEIQADLFDVDSYADKLSKNGEVNFDLVRKRAVKETTFFRHIRTHFRSGQHNISVRYINNEAWLYVRVIGRDRSLFNPLSWFMNVEIKGQSARARLIDVIEAYKRIGIKQNTTSITQALSQVQREKENNEGVFNMVDAFAIARIIRVNEQSRFEALVNC